MSGAGCYARQRGVALVGALFVMLVLTMTALAVARIAFDAERSARAGRDRQLAFQAAEAGLADAQRDIDGGDNPASARAALFHDDGAIGFVAGCGRAPDNLGLCAFMPGTAPAWQVADVLATTPYGSYTGAILPYDGALPLAPPRYLIERMPAAQAGEDAGPGQPHVFRITAFGYGIGPGTLVVLQAVYRGAAMTPGQP
jgi:Tfp pilus assembly protein PilX